MQASEAGRSIALCLSGGGLRATLFHLGVIRALRCFELDGKLAIERVSEIYSVSGGSILAAHMRLNWPSYIGSNEKYLAAEREVLKFVMRNIRDRVLRRAILRAIMVGIPSLIWRALGGQTRSGRVHFLCREYHGLFGQKRLGECSGEDGPKLHILATSFRTGELCSFSDNMFEVERTGGGMISTPCDHIRFSFAVACSSAFPPMFPPMLVTDDLLANPFDEAFLNPILLSDGGIFDNLGIEKFRLKMKEKRAADEPRPEIVLISNAGSSFRTTANKSYAGLIPRNIRATDILMRRVGDSAQETINRMKHVDDVALRLSAVEDDGSLDVPIQQRLRMVRTDLDRFSPKLSAMLVEHGERITHAALTRKQQEALKTDAEAKEWIAKAPPTKPTMAGNEELLNRIAANAAKRSFWSLGFDHKDWTTYAIWLIAISLLVAITIFLISYSNARTLENNVEKNSLLIEKKFNQQTNLMRAARTELENKNFAKVDKLLKSAYDLAQAGAEEASEVTQKPIQAAVKPNQALRGAEENAVTPLPQPHLQTVYIQFAGNLSREQIRELNATLRQAGWRAQGGSGERIESANGFNEVRYSGSNRAAAQALADAVKLTGIVEKPVEIQQVKIVGGNVLELWISK